jgi:hypothetical protein
MGKVEDAIRQVEIVPAVFMAGTLTPAFDHLKPSAIFVTHVCEGNVQACWQKKDGQWLRMAIWRKA